MKCPNCGKEIANDSVYCEFCGEKVVFQRNTNQETDRNAALMWGGLASIAVASMYSLFVLGNEIDWYLGYNRISILGRSLMDLFLPILLISLVIVVLYKSWKLKNKFLQNSSVTTKWLLWGVVCGAINILVGVGHYTWIMLTMEGAKFEYVVWDFIYEESGNFLIIIGFACLLLWGSKQPRVETTMVDKSIKPWHILVIALVISMIIVLV
ncbi:MAG: zinc-ribbon domain-containing protein [Paludibacteraceae bacterium]|nr:zinc-ribbon domain-containing protein [Paludibacteraceae bacterium]